MLARSSVILWGHQLTGGPAMDAKTETLTPAARLAAREPGAHAERERRIPRRAHRAAGRGDRAETPDRARRRPAAGAAARRTGGRRLSLRDRGWADRLRRPVWRQGNARRLQLHVRAAARAALPDVHQSPRRLGRQRRRHRAEASRWWSSPVRRSRNWSPGSASAAGSTCGSPAISTTPSAATTSPCCRTAPRAGF